MRELKFRTWHKDFFEPEMIYFSFSEGLRSLMVPGADGIEGYGIEQFTGLRDKNGRDIYEGDILRDKWDGVGVVGFGWYVTPTSEDRGGGQSAWGFGVYHEQHSWAIDDDYSEVIGNVHENPELLEEQVNG